MAPPKLILHFDVNNTIFIGDTVTGDSLEDSLNAIVCKMAFVRLKGGAGTAAEARAATAVDQLEWMNGHAIDGSAVDPNAVMSTQWDWPAGCVPFDAVKALKKQYSQVFTDKGSPGHCLRAVFKRLQQGLVVPPTDHPVDPRLTSECGQYWLVVPSFFEMLEGLKVTMRHFSVVFRTFGDDGPRVAAALTAYAEGKHPLFAGIPSLAVDVPDEVWTGRYRDDGTYTLTSTSADGVETRAMDETAAVKRIEDRDAAGPSARVVVDDYAFWKANYHAPEAGKPLWIDLADRTHHHIFFDDNIHNSDEDSIVAVRVRDREQAPFTPLSGFRALHLQGVFLVRVPTMLAILDETWFLARINDAETRKAGLQKGGRLLSICRGRPSQLSIGGNKTSPPKPGA